MSTKRVLVTGMSGFVGRALVPLLEADQEIQLFTSTRKETDLSVYESVKKLIADSKPTHVYHLAGAISEEFDTAYKGNVLAARNIFETVREECPSARVLLVGSAAEYGNVLEKDNPIKETQPLLPLSVYGLTKMYQSQLMDLYVRKFGMDIVLARPFNIYGEGAHSRMLVGKIQNEIEQLRKGEISKITIFDPDNLRDYVSVAEVAKDLKIVMEKGKSGETYNVGSGIPVRAGDFIRKMLLDAGVPVQNIEEKQGKSSVPVNVADITKLEHLKK